MKHHIGLPLALIMMLAVSTGCATEVPGVYRGGQRTQQAPLDIQEHYSFRFVDKWRISHSWLSGPLELRGCQGYGSNSFRRLGGYGSLGIENMEPIIEKNGAAYVVYEHKGIFKISSPRNYIYGTNREGKFEGFSPFCVDVFQKDSLDGLALYIIKPDPAKGTNEWIEGAKPITINGLQWLHKTIPIQDWSKSRERLTSPIEIWVLKIPDTQYWMMLRFSAISGSQYGFGAGAHPEKHQQLLDLFHKIVASVKLEPITPINIDYLIK
jgi:hypothetical protein